MTIFNDRGFSQHFIAPFGPKKTIRAFTNVKVTFAGKEIDGFMDDDAFFNMRTNDLMRDAHRMMQGKAMTLFERDEQYTHRQLMLQRYGFDHPVNCPHGLLSPDCERMLSRLDLRNMPVPMKVRFGRGWDTIVVSVSMLVEDIAGRGLIPVDSTQVVPPSARTTAFELLGFLRAAMRTLLLHELDEQLLVDGTRPFDPHKPAAFTYAAKI